MSISTIRHHMGTATSAQLGRWSDQVAAWFNLEQRLNKGGKIASALLDEFKKHWLITGLLWGLVFYVDKSFAVTLLVFVAMVLMFFKFGAFWIWARGWKAALVADHREIPSWKVLWETRDTLEKREEALLADWPRLCTMHGLASNKRTPPIVNLRPDLDLDFTAFSPRVGFDPDDIKAKAAKIAKGLGCKGGILVRETSFGACEIVFRWTNLIQRELPLRELKMPVNGGIALGHTDTGKPAELRMDASKVFVGVPGSGKSNGAEAALADLVRRGEYVRLRVSNPKKNEMRIFKQFEKESKGRLEVRAYAESGPDNLQMLKDAAHAMGVRNGVMKGRKLTKTTPDNPLDITWLDEMMMLPKEAYKDGPYSPLGQLAIAGRASLFTVWGCTQMFYAADFGSVRGLFDERVLFRVKTSVQADMVIDDATKRGAAAHRIHPTKERGVGYIEDEHGELTKFRAAHVEDADLERIIRGQVPEGMITEATPKAVEEDKPTEQKVYFIEAQGTDLVKIGIAANPPSRLKELQTASPHKLSIITTMPGGKPHERHLHHRFKATRATGEWFHRTPELDAYIAEVKAGGGKPAKAVKAARKPRTWSVAKLVARLFPAEPKTPRVTAPDFFWWEPNYKPSQRV